MRTIALFLPNWVGDVVMATPALRALREHFGADELIGVMRPYVADVLAGTNLLDGCILDPSRGLTRGVLRLARALDTADPGHRMELFTTPADEAAVDRVWTELGLDQHAEVIGVNNSGAFGAAKLWPVEHFATLAR